MANVKYNLKQKTELVAFMEVNYKFLFGKVGSLQTKKEKWNILATTLNALGPTKKDADKWKKVSFS